jgi:hypothetical protein
LNLPASLAPQGEDSQHPLPAKLVPISENCVYPDLN